MLGLFLTVTFNSVYIRLMKKEIATRYQDHQNQNQISRDCSINITMLAEAKVKTTLV